MRVQLQKGDFTTYKWKIWAREDAAMRPTWYSETENAGVVATYGEGERIRRFEALSFGQEGNDPRTIVDMELIWLVAFAAVGKDPRALILSLRGSIPWHDAFDELAFESGVEHQIGAYLQGAILEHVLFGIRFEPENRALDFPWPDSLPSGKESEAAESWTERHVGQ